MNDIEPERPRDEEAVARFVERFALLMTEGGMQRMAARVFALIMASPEGAHTAAEIAQRLEISPAAVSGAVRYLTELRLIVRDREPGQRRDVFRIGELFWYDTMARKNRAVTDLLAVAAEGVAVLGADTPAGHRMLVTQDFLTHMTTELPKLLDRWRAERAAG
ncbi:MarR family transcriptional regulator [Crossiella sp. CA-258035]|uniref:GbsR/MarR family transcriptional regulator n=1 Tax=Crossiella sp. CA-258035 TaxID=2981138 RepID=UPI0024BC355E|nr:MarR family transcriptional regulator [Crossiella sp. CA-258035]WHT15804.1 MarR family transcriptional regulator [Crossiella sp. CA-258035]